MSNLDEFLDKGDKIGGIGSFILALIALFTGKSLAVVLLFLALAVLLFLLIVLLRRERSRLQEREQFIAGKGFKLVSFKDNQTFSLARLGPITSAPFGRTWMGCVPFEILAEKDGLQFIEVKPKPNNAPDISEIRVEIDRVDKVFLLINAGFGLKSWNQAQPGEGWDEKVIGRLHFEFGDGSNQKQELRLGHHLRDLAIGNQPYAVDRLRSEQTREVWLSPQRDLALDCLQIEFSKPRFLCQVIVSAKLEVDQPPQVAFEGEPIGFPFIRIFGITCWTVD